MTKLWKLNKEIKQFSRREQSKHLETLCLGLEQHAIRNKSREPFDKVKLGISCGILSLVYNLSKTRTGK